MSTKALNRVLSVALSSFIAEVGLNTSNLQDDSIVIPIEYLQNAMRLCSSIDHEKSKISSGLEVYIDQYKFL